jgi:glycosyltransferase involved in cell wall biosynthesis
MRPRVLLVGPMPPTKGGVTTFMLNLMASPLAAEVMFIPFTTSRPPKQNVTDNWGYGAMLRGGPRRILTGMLVTAWHLASFPFVVLRQRADLVQIQASDYQVFWEAGLYAAMARLLRRPVLFRIGGAFDLFWGNASWLERRLISAVLRLPACVIAQSAFARDVIRRAGREGEIVLLPNWSHAVAAPSRVQGEAVSSCLFIAGLEAKRKGVEEVLAAIEILHRRRVAVRLHIVAATPALMQRVKAIGIAGLTAEGPASHDRILMLMQRHAIFLLPSHGEGFPNSLVEAMAAGMACIASPVGAVPEMADGGGIVLVAAGDALALADAVSRLAETEAARDELGNRARRTVALRYTARAALPGLAASYRRLAGAVLVDELTGDVAVEAVR